jgi:hypothetical protein
MPPKRRLTLQYLENIKPADKPVKYTDGAGLYLLVQPSGSAYWRYRFRFAGKQNTVSCGVYPSVSLDQARERHDALRALLAAGINPSHQTQQERAEALDAQRQQLAASRFLLDSHGALFVHLGARRFHLSPKESADLRIFLNATSAVTTKV